MQFNKGCNSRKTKLVKQQHTLGKHKTTYKPNGMTENHDFLNHQNNETDEKYELSTICLLLNKIFIFWRLTSETNY
jgi:hypothetical protein